MAHEFAPEVRLGSGAAVVGVDRQFGQPVDTGIAVQGGDGCRRRLRDRLDGCRTGITYQQAAAHDSANPSDPWILRDSAGKPITSTSYAHNYLANVGSASYQQQWATNVIGAAKRLGFDGTTLDNVSANISGWPGWSGVYPTRIRQTAPGRRR